MVSRSCVVALAAFAAGACGGSQDRLDLKTPGAHTGTLPTATLAPPPTATPKPKPTPAPKRARITRSERRVIRGWSEALRHGRVTAAARYFSIPSVVQNGFPAFLTSRAEVRQFNRGLSCGAKLLGVRRGAAHAVLATFRLVNRPGAECGTGTGALAAAKIIVRRHLIIEWLRADDQVDPAIAAKSPAATPTPTPSATATPTSTP
jgi:hypothetical protein